VSTLPFEIDERIDDAGPDIERDHRADPEPSGSGRANDEANDQGRHVDPAFFSSVRCAAPNLVIDTPTSLAGADLFARRALDTKPAEPARDS
jgi:hypothetical protein